MVFILVLGKNFILSCFFFFFLILDLYFLVPAVSAKIFNPITSIVIPIGIPFLIVFDNSILTDEFFEKVLQSF